jgi:hypothetical protein
VDGVVEETGFSGGDSGARSGADTEGPGGMVPVQPLPMARTTTAIATSSRGNLLK